MVTDVGSHPAMLQLQSVQKAMAMPAFGAAVGQVGALYSKVKGAHSLLQWALSSAEAGVTLAAVTAAPYMAAPLAGADARVSAALDALERRVPLVAEEPKVIVETTKQAVMARVTPHVNKLSPQMLQARAAATQRVHSLKELSWAKANSLLSTAYGQKAMMTVDTGASVAMQMLDYYLPPVGAQQEVITKDIVSASSDPARHTVQTVGRLSAVAARRLWANLACKVNELRQSGIELDVRRYVTALLAALQLAAATRMQQQQQHDRQPQPQTQAQPQPQQPPTPRPPQPDTQTTAAKVKATPEVKSTKDEGME